MSVAGGVSQGLARARKIKIPAVQIFTKNNNRWQEKPQDPEEVARFREAAREFRREHLISHAAYLINLASFDDTIYGRSMAAMRDELDRAEALGLSWVVLHPGSHMGNGEDVGIKRIAESLSSLLKDTKSYTVGIALECTAGQGTALGYRFEHLAAIRKKVRSRKRLGVCLDTCHMFAAGYELRTAKGYRATMDELDATVGIEHVHAIHVNDSKKPLGSRVDRHDHIGDGELGLDGFKYLLNDPRFAHTPMMLETPKGPEMKEDVRNLRRLKSLVGKVRFRP
jgi:deoxyribonuclease-4